MSESEFLPLPQPKDFDDAFEHADVIVQGRNPDTLNMHWDAALSNYAALFIPYESDKQDANSYTPARAFSQGFMMASPVNEIIYGGRYIFPDYYSSLNAWMLAQDTHLIEDERAWFEANAYLVEKYSKGGLDRIGTSSRQVAERWGSELYSDPALSRVFTLGCGALVMSGIIHQRSMNEYAISAASFSTQLEQDIETLLASGDSNE